MATNDEKGWFKKFYEGTLFVKGWKHHMHEMLRQAPPGEKEKIRELLESLGKKIGYEWAKDNEIRKINTAMLQQWGNDLHKATKNGTDTLIAKLHSLDREVDDLLS